MKFNFCFLFLLNTLISHAQNATIKNNTVKVNDSAQFKIFSVGTFSHPTFKIKNLQDEDLILIDQTNMRENRGNALLKFNFLNNEKLEAYIPNSINAKKEIALLLVNYNVITNNSLNEKALQLFCKNYALNNYPSKYIPDNATSTSESVIADTKVQIIQPENKTVQSPNDEVVTPIEPTNIETQKEKIISSDSVVSDLSKEIILSPDTLQQEIIVTSPQNTDTIIIDTITPVKIETEKIISDVVDSVKVIADTTTLIKDISSQVDTTLKVIVENIVKDTVATDSGETTSPELDDNGLVIRDIEKPLFLSGNSIRQDSKEIGSYKVKEKMLLGQEGKEIIIYAINGDKIGAARYILGDEQCELLTSRDKKTWNIPIPKEDIYSIVNEIVKVLTGRMYL